MNNLFVRWLTKAWQLNEVQTFSKLDRGRAKVLVLVLFLDQYQLCNILVKGESNSFQQCCCFISKKEFEFSQK